MHATRRTNVKMLAAVIGGSAVVAAGAVTMAITEEQALTRKIDRRNLQDVARPDDDQRVGGQAVDRAMHRRAAETGHAL